MDDRVIAVTGATGRQGGAVARRLLAAGWRVRAVTRDPDGDGAQRLREAGAEVVGADMDEARTLVAAFAGAHGVYSVQNPMISGHEAEIRQGRNVAEAAQQSGVAHVVYAGAGPGVPGTGVGSWESKVQVAAHARDLGVPLTVLRPMAFMELMTDKAFYPAVSTWHLMPKLVGADRPLPWLAVDDLAAIAARAFAEPERFVGRDLALASDVRSIDECRAIWRDATGRAPRGFPMPVRLFQRFVGDDLITMWRWLRTGDTGADVDGTRAILPSAATVQEWVLARQSKPRRPGG